MASKKNGAEIRSIRKPWKGTIAVLQSLGKVLEKGTAATFFFGLDEREW